MVRGGFGLQKKIPKIFRFFNFKVYLDAPKVGQISKGGFSALVATVFVLGDRVIGPGSFLSSRPIQWGIMVHGNVNMLTTIFKKPRGRLSLRNVATAFHRKCAEGNYPTLSCHIWLESPMFGLNHKVWHEAYFAHLLDLVTLSKWVKFPEWIFRFKTCFKHTLSWFLTNIFSCKQFNVYTTHFKEKTASIDQSVRSG